MDLWHNLRYETMDSSHKTFALIGNFIFELTFEMRKRLLPSLFYFLQRGKLSSIFINLLNCSHSRQSTEQFKNDPPYQT